MERIVGKYWYLLCVLISVYAYAEVSMRVTDENGAPLEAVGVGQPFLLLVDIKNAPTIQPVIENLDRYEHMRTGVQMTNINGVANATYSYRCRIDSLGLHPFGPATLPGTQEKWRCLHYRFVSSRCMYGNKRRKMLRYFFEFRLNQNR